MKSFGIAGNALALGAAFLAGATVLGTAQTVIDAIVIGPDKIDVALPLKFSIDEGGRENINLGGDHHAIGVQRWTTYMRTNENFAWYTGGTFKSAKLDPGGGKLAMRLTDSDLHVSGTINGMGAVPKGAIMMWSGSIDQIPDGWRLARGGSENGVNIPNLSGRFIVAADPEDFIVSGEYRPGNSGGSNEVKLTLDNLPSHDHGAGGTHSHRLGMRRGTVAGNGKYPLSGYDDNDGAAATTDSAGEHSHASVGGGAAFDNRPQWFALAFIIYVGPSDEVK